MWRIFDAVFVNQLFRADERGRVVFYPNGVTGRGYLVPPAREPGLRAGVRWLTFAALVWVLVVIVIVPRAVESWLGYTLPLPWFVAGAGLVTVATVAVIIRALGRLTAGLEPVGK